MTILASKEICVGCTACMNICSKQCLGMSKDNDGFVYPEIMKSSVCVNCDSCKQVCPVLKKEVRKDALPLVYAAFSRAEMLRIESSSGGIFSEIAKVIIEKDGVVYGAAYNESFEVYHRCVDNVAELSKLRGAKYSESYLGNVFSEIKVRLKQGQYVLFTGTPCQVAGLKAFLKRDYKNLICIDFVCHGVPSPMAWKEYIKYRAQQDADGKMPVAINLRSKITGWSKYQYSNLFQYDNGKEYSSISSQSLFMKLFVGDYISRPSCSTCKFKGYHRVSDMTLGDFWGIWDIEPEMDDNKGTSVVLLQSEKAQLLWEEIKDKIVFKQVSLENASQQNPSMLFASKAKENREEVLAMIREGNIGKCTELFIPPKASWRARVQNKLGRIANRVLGN